MDFLLTYHKCKFNMHCLIHLVSSVVSQDSVSWRIYSLLFDNDLHDLLDDKINALKFQQLHLGSKLFITAFHIHVEIVPTINQISHLELTICSELCSISHISMIASKFLSSYAVILKTLLFS